MAGIKPEPHALEVFLKAAFAHINPNDLTISRDKINDVCDTIGLPYPKWLIDPSNKVVHGVYTLKNVVKSYKAICQIVGKLTRDEEEDLEIESQEFEDVQIYENVVGAMLPKADPLYVKFGFHDYLSKIISTKLFYPVYITGHSGNGKTTMVEQVCAENKREIIRVNITVETDEGDLLGGIRLDTGSTTWYDGPVVTAMKTGAVLLLDEVDLASTKIMCLQPVLEGKGVFLKKISTYVVPEKGFTIIATANTKGRGSDDGRYIGTNMMNDAFLERFPITIEQEYPSESTERKILKKVLKKNGIVANDFAKNLAKLSASIKKTFEEDGVDDILTTRRLVHIAKAYAIFGDPAVAFSLCIARYDTRTKDAFIHAFNAICSPTDKYGAVNDPKFVPSDDIFKF